jgi:holliday junction DNA helicase RuvA
MAGNETEKEWEQDMISYVKGPLMGIEEDVIVVEAGSLGLAVHVPVSLLPELPGLGQEVTVYTYFQVREDAMTLYGFLHPQDRDMFRQLLGVNGIGPKGALGILSVLRPDDLRLAIVSEDVKALAKAPGIGTKTAQRMILDLKDKISMDDVLGSMASGTDLGTGSGAAAMAGLAEAAKEAVQALVALGYTNSEASRAVKQVEIVDGMTSEDVLKASLKHLSFL